jgi:hypothetical protein
LGVLVLLRYDCATREGAWEFLAEKGNAFIAELLHVAFGSDTGQKCEEGGEVGVRREVVKVS